MAKRTVKVKLSYDVILDDDREGLPPVTDVVGFALAGACKMPGIVEIKNVKLNYGLDRESINELRRRDRVRRANAR